MIKMNGVDCSFHHMGIPTTEARAGERFSTRIGIFTSDSECRVLRIQWHRFTPGSEIHSLIRTIPHVAFKVEDLDTAIAGWDVLLGPYEPIPGFRVAMIQDGGCPVEFIETAIPDEELWRSPMRGNSLYVP